MNRRLEDDPVFYRIRYSLLAQELHKATVKPKKGDAHRPEPLPGEKKLSEQTLELIAETAEELRRLGWRWVGAKPSWLVRLFRRRRDNEYVALGEFLDGVFEPAAVVMYWSCRVNEGDWELAEQALSGKLPTLPRGWRNRRNIPKRLLIAMRRRRRRLRQMDRRRLTIGRGRKQEAWLKNYLAILTSPANPQRPFFGKFLIKLGFSRLQPLPPPGYRVHYNLACLHWRLATCNPDGNACQRHRDEAHKQWRECLAEASEVQEARLSEWARKDPALKGLLGD